MKNAESPEIPAPSSRRKAYSYVRFSSPEQAKGDSYRRQTVKARDYADRKNLDLDESFVDRGVSGFKGANRSPEAALGTFVACVESGEVPSDAVLIVESLDRLSREKAAVAMEFFLTLTRKGLTVVTLADNEKEHSRQSMNDDPFQLMGSLMVMIRAHEESAIKSQRVGDAWKIKKKRAIDTKQAMTSRCPGWLRLVGGPKEGRYEIIDERAKLVRQWFDDTIAGIGRRTITRELNTRGLPRWGIGESMGDRWHDSYVAKVISNPATYGTYATTDGSGTLIEIGGYFPAIVDETTFWKAQAASQGRGHGKGSTGKTHRNVLRGLAKCEFCAANMVILDKGRKSKGLKLRCGKAHQSAGCDHRTMYDYGVVEIGVIHGLGDKIAQLSAASVATAKAAAEEVKSVEANRADREKQLGRLLDLVAAGGDVPQVALRVKLLGDEIAILRTQEEDIRRKFGMASVADPVSDVVDLGTIYAELRRLTAEERIKARAEISEKLVHLVDRVVVGPNGFVTHLKDGGFSTMVRVGVNTRHGN